MRDDFAVFILSHGRANNILTWATLDRRGYTGKRYIIIDDEDDEAAEYRRLYGDHVVQFCKINAAKHTDTMDTLPERNVVVFARNECHRIAKELGLKYFLELDDDYTEFLLRYIDGNKMGSVKFTDLDGVFSAFVDFLEVSGAKTVCFAQGGDFIGGAQNGRFEKGLMRKAMNSFFCKVDRPFKFLGRTNEDTCAYTLGSSRGDLFFTVTRVMLTQVQTQAQKGGLTEEYLEHGTYVKSFYTVMCMPSAVTVRAMGASHKRMHHFVEWNKCAPMILSERWKK